MEGGHQRAQVLAGTPGGLTEMPGVTTARLQAAAPRGDPGAQAGTGRALRPQDTPAPHVEDGLSRVTTNPGGHSKGPHGHHPACGKLRPERAGLFNGVGSTTAQVAVKSQHNQLKN